MTLPEALTRLHAAGRIRSAWLPGMLTLQYGVPARLAWLDKAGRWNLSGNSGEWLRYASMDGIVLDPSDPATVGCLLALLREAMRDPSVYLAPNAESMIRPDGTSPLWFAYTGRGKGPIGVGPTEYAAVVAALDAAAERLEPTP